MKSIICFIVMFLLGACAPAHNSMNPVMPDDKVAAEPQEAEQPKQIIPKESEGTAPKVVLITLDGVRWQDLYNGTQFPFQYKKGYPKAREIVPNLYTHFVDKGMAGGKKSMFIASGPMHISLPGYLEIMRGHPSLDCQTNECEPKLEDTMVDLFDSAAVFASWDTIRKATGKNNDKYVVNCGRDYRSEGWKKLGLFDRKDFQEYWDPIYRPDFLTIEAVNDYLQNNTPQFLWVSLGDTDEWAHAGNYNNYIDSLKEGDKFIGDLIQRYGTKNTTFIVTADHGRGINWMHHGGDVESSFDWFMMTGREIPAKGLVRYSNVKRLSNILPTVKHLISGKRGDDSLLEGIK